MKKIIISTIVFYLLFYLNVSAAQANYYEEGIILYNKNKFDESKFFFEKDIVFNPKSEKSYLYLAKIFKKNDNEEEQEINLKNVLLINPQNDEAIYMLAIIKINQSDYNQAKELIDQFTLICKSFCSKKNEIDEKFGKLNPENAKVEN